MIFSITVPDFQLAVHGSDGHCLACNALCLQSTTAIIGDTVREDLVFLVDDKRPARLLPSIEIVILILERRVITTGNLFVATCHGLRVYCGSSS